MRRRSLGLAVLAAVLTVGAGTDTSAHRRDEYLQGARLALQHDAVLIELDVTPGSDVADAFLRTLDRDDDQSLSAIEQRGYAQQVTSALVVSIDGEALPVRLVSAEFPERAAILRGDGAIRLQARAPLTRVSPGAHRLRFRNTHLADHSAYLANAMVPESARLTVTAQRRTFDQRELTIEFAVGAAPQSGLAAWGLAGAAMLGVVVLRARRRSAH